LQIHKTFTRSPRINNLLKKVFGLRDLEREAPLPQISPVIRLFINRIKGVTSFFFGDLPMKILKLTGILLSLALVVGCGSKIDCVEKGFTEDLSGLVAENMNAQLFAIYWDEVMEQNTKITVSAVKELKISENKKSVTCAATVSVKLPVPSAKSEVTESLLLGIRAAEKGNIYAAFTDTTAPVETVSVDIEYEVTSLEKAAADGRKVEVSIKNAKDIVMPVLYRNIQMVGSDVSRPLSDGSKPIWKPEQVASLKKQILEQKQISEQDKTTRVCVIQKTASWISYETYMAYLSFATAGADRSNPMLAMAVGMWSDKPPMSNLLEFEKEATKGCGGKG
jgi:hypothetical protein